MADQEQPSSSHRDGGDLVLVARGPAWGLPTSCPFCLPSFVYLKLAEVDFSIYYNDLQPDSDDMPALEYRDMVGLPGDTGGIIEFLKRQDIADLDSGFSNAEVAHVRSLSAMVESYLQATLLCELWGHDNSKVAHRIYFTALPWPVSKLLYWKQQVHVWEILGLKKTNMEEKVGELERKAAEAYESLSNLLGDQKFFMKTRPSSLDALFLSHALFVLHVPLENSQLKEEFLKHANLVRYAEGLRQEFLEGQGMTPIAKSIYANPRRTASYSTASSKTQREQEPKERSEKVKLFKRRAKCFLAAQAVAVLAFAYIWGVSLVDEGLLEEYTDNESE